MRGHRMENPADSKVNRREKRGFILLTILVGELLPGLAVLLLTWDGNIQYFVRASW